MKNSRRTSLLLSAALGLVPVSLALAAPASAATTYTVSSISPMTQPDGVSYDATDDTVYVVGYQDDGSVPVPEVVPVDPSDNSAGTPISLGDDGSGYLASTLDAAGGRLFVSFGDDTLVIVDLSDGHLTDVSLEYDSTFFEPNAMAWDATNSTLYMNDWTGGPAGVYTLDLSGGGQTLGLISTDAVNALTADPGDNLVYGQSLGSAATVVIDGTDNSATVGAGGAFGSIGIQYDATSGRVYFGNDNFDPDGQNLAYLHAGQVTSTSAIAGFGGGSALDPGQTLFALSNGTDTDDNPAGSVIPVDLSTGAAGTPVDLGSHYLMGADADTSNHAAYVVTDSGVDVLVPHTSTATETSTALTTSTSFGHAGQKVTLTATVTGATVNGDPGQVYFFDQLGNPVTGSGAGGCKSSQAINAARQVVCTVAWDSPGTHQVQAFYTDGWGPDADSTSALTGVTVVDNDATLSLKAAHAQVTDGGSVLLNGVLSTGDEPATGRSVALSYLSGTSWVHLATTTSGAGGAYAFKVKPTHNTSYRATYAGSTGILAGTSPTSKVMVASKVTVAASKAKVRKGSKVVFTGAVAPAQQGQKVSLQRFSGGAWHTVATARLGSTSHYRLTTHATKTCNWRVSRAADSTNAAGVSPQVRVRVH